MRATCLAQCARRLCVHAAMDTDALSGIELALVVRLHRKALGSSGGFGVVVRSDAVRSDREHCVAVSCTLHRCPPFTLRILPCDSTSVARHLLCTCSCSAVALC